MDILNQFIIPPNEQQLMLIRYLQGLTFIIHLPYVGMVIGGTLLSVVLNLLDRDKHNPMYGRLSRDVMGIVVPNKIVVLVFGILPLLAIWMTYSEWLYKAPVNTLGLLVIGAIVVALSFPIILAYRATLHPNGRNSNVNVFLGLMGLGVLAIGYYVFLGSITRFHDPEKWFLVYHPVRLLASWNLIWHYLYFFVGAIGIAAAALLFFFFSWPGRTLGEPDADYEKFVKNLAAGMAMPALLLMPPFAFFYVFTTPAVGLTGALFWITAVIALVLFVIFVYFYCTILSSRPRFGSHTFVLFVVVFALFVMGDQLTFVTATKEHAQGLVAQAEERELQITMEREAHMADAAKVDLVRGEEVFKTICTTCHGMDERLVGPPLRMVLPKYEGKLDELVSFIQNPSKVDPAYPPMPAPGLPLGDVKSVAAYVLEAYEESE